MLNLPEPNPNPPPYEIGDTITYRTIMGNLRRVVVSDKGLKNGEIPTFDGYLVYDDGKRITCGLSDFEVWGYDEDILTNHTRE